MFPSYIHTVRLVQHSRKGIINATGPFTHSVLTPDNPSHKPIVKPSFGFHVTLPSYHSSGTTGLLDLATSDGRVIFLP